MEAIRRSVLLLALPFCAGCATALPSVLPRAADAYKSHYVIAHDDGYPIDPDNRLRTEMPPSLYRSFIQDRILHGIDTYARTLWPTVEPGQTAPGPPLRLLLFVHGGLNGYGADFDRMKAMLPNPGAPCSATDTERPLFPAEWCTRAKSRYYPVFVNWNSDLLDSVGDDLFFIRFGDRMRSVPQRAFGFLTAPFIFAARVADGLFGAPQGFLAGYGTFKESDPRGWDYVESTAMSPVRVISLPILKAFGTSAWQLMKRRADLLVTERLDPVRGQARPRGRCDQEGADEPEPPRQGAALTLWNLLCGRIHPSTPPGGQPLWRIGPPDQSGGQGPIEITLVGHSMGALVLNRLLAAQHSLPVAHIIYIAPASSVEETEWFVEPYLRGNPRGAANFWTFTLTARDEASERRPKSFVFPWGSLLVWIDNFFELPTEPGDFRSGRLVRLTKYYGEPLPIRVCTVEDPTGKPLRHDTIAGPRYLERILRKVDPNAFEDARRDDDALAGCGRSAPTGATGRLKEG